MPQDTPSQQSSSLLILSILCIVFFIFTIFMVSRVLYVGGAEDAGYALIAKNLAQGNGFSTDAIVYYWTPYVGVVHPDDTSPPLLSLLIAPLFSLFGVSAFLAKLPSIFLGIVALPLAVYFLGRELYNRKVAFIAALVALFSPLSFPTIVHAEAESVFAFFVVLAALFFVKGIEGNENNEHTDGENRNRKNCWWFVAMGAALGLAFLTKYTGILVVAAVIGAYAYLLWRKKAAFSWLFVLGLLIAFLVVFPWLLRNYLLFGNPLYALGRHITPFLGGLLPFTRFPIDGAAPTFFTAVQKLGVLALVIKTISQLFAILVALLPLHILSVWGIVKTDTADTKKKAFTTFIVILYILFVLFHSIYWQFEYGYFIPLVALLILPAVYTVTDLLPMLFRLRPSFSSLLRRSVPVALFLIIVFFFIVDASKFFYPISLKGMSSPSFPFVDDAHARDMLDAASWAEQNIPAGEPIFFRQPRGFSFHSNHPALIIPEEGYAKMREVASAYNVQYTQCNNTVVPLGEGVSEGLELVYRSGFSICRIV